MKERETSRTRKGDGWLSTPCQRSRTVRRLSSNQHQFTKIRRTADHWWNGARQPPLSTTKECATVPCLHHIDHLHLVISKFTATACACAGVECWNSWKSRRRGMEGGGPFRSKCETRLLMDALHKSSKRIKYDAQNGHLCPTMNQCSLQNENIGRDRHFSFFASQPPSPFPPSLAVRSSCPISQSS